MSHSVTVWQRPEENVTDCNILCDTPLICTRNLTTWDGTTFLFDHQNVRHSQSSKFDKFDTPYVRHSICSTLSMFYIRNDRHSFDWLFWLAKRMRNYYSHCFMCFLFNNRIYSPDTFYIWYYFCRPKFLR